MSLFCALGISTQNALAQTLAPSAPALNPSASLNQQNATPLNHTSQLIPSANSGKPINPANPSAFTVNHWYYKGFMYAKDRDYKNAFVWMFKAANTGFAPAQQNVGLSYLHALGVEKDFNKAFIWFERAADQGLKNAQTNLGALYYNGDGTQENLDKAGYYWLKAAKQNDEHAQYNFASLSFETHQYDQAVYWMSLAEHNGHPDAAAALKAMQKFL